MIVLNGSVTMGISLICPMASVSLPVKLDCDGPYFKEDVRRMTWNNICKLSDRTILNTCSLGVQNEERMYYLINEVCKAI